MMCLAKRTANNAIKETLVSKVGSLEKDTFNCGDSVIITYDGDELGTATYIASNDAIYSRLVFCEHWYVEPPELDLPAVVEESPDTRRGQKALFHELQTDDIFIWKTERLCIQANRRYFYGVREEKDTFKAAPVSVK